MKIQVSVCVAGLPNEEESYFATVVKDENVVGKTNPRTGNGTFQELVLLDDENATVNVMIYAVGKDDVVAQQSFDLTAVLNSYTIAQAKPAQDDGASIAVHVTEQTNGKLRLTLQGHDLPNTDFGLFGNQKTDPIFEICNHLGKKLARSNKIDDELNPVWDEMVFDLEELCGKRLKTPLQITVFDRDQGDSVEYLGTVTMTVHHMLNDGAAKVPLLKGGAIVPGASLSVKHAELLPDVTVSHSATTTMEAAISALTDLEKLKDQVASLEQAAEEAKAQADVTKEEAKEKQAAADVLAQAQLELQTKFAQMARNATQVAKDAETKEFAGTLHLILAAQDLADVDFGVRNKSDPLYEIFVVGKKSGAPLVRSNKVDNDLNPVWDERTLELSQVDGLDTPLKIQVSDKDGKDEQHLLGYVETSIQKLLDSKNEGNSFVMRLLGQPNPDKDTGRLVVQKATLEGFCNMKEKAETLRMECAAVQTELEAATQTFVEAQKEAELAKSVAAQAAEAAAQAAEQVKAAKMAVETAEASM
ncbi:hypothetical protein ACA910_019928 [Epithemia clementina (nom. ined.)]